MALSREQARSFDRWAIEELGIPAPVLMENAGRGAAEVLLAQDVRGPVVVCCGKGNNGGDGLVIARHLWNRHLPVTAHLFTWPKAVPEALSEDMALQWRIVQRLGIPMVAWPTFEESRLADELRQADWVVDALFGTGLEGPVRSPFDRLIACINACPARVLAVDIPSGLNADTGEPMGPTVRAHHTVTFVAPKLGYSQPAARAWLGQVHVADIGVVSA